MMQYILTEEEYNSLRARQEFDIKIQRDKLQTLCTHIANTMPVTVKWFNDGQPTPWGCILTEDHGDHYCDECPVQDICPHEYKEWSK